METLAGLLGALPFAALLRGSVLAYALVNATHILGIALLLGAILPLDLRLIGVIGGPALSELAPFLSRVAACGLAIAVLSGILLISVSPTDYLANPAFRWKVALIAAAMVNVALVHRNPAWQVVQASGRVAPSLRRGAAVSAALWLCVLVAGRMIGFL